jgi:hypothetical protein
MGRFVAPALLAGLVLTLLPRECAAQSFGISIGSGHYHGWHHHHCWDDPWFWGPHFDYVYVAPPPPRVVYVQPREVEVRTIVPQDSTARPATNSLPRTSSDRLAASTADAGGTVQIFNGGSQKIPVAFLVDSRQVELHDGQSHSLHGSGKRTVEFDRGGDFGTARYELSPGQYEFVVTSRGWDLVRRPGSSQGISMKPLMKKNVLPEDTATR